MESVYKNKLLALKNKNAPESFGQLLFDHMNWTFVSPEKLLVASEKIDVIQDFAQFANKSLKETGAEKISFSGGEVVKKTTPSDHEVKEINKEEYLKTLMSLISESEIALRFHHLREIKVIFVFDKYYSGSKAQKNLSLFLKDDTLELFSRMISAMKLKPEEVLFSSISIDINGDEKDYLKYLNQEIYCYKPKLIITLGAEPAMRLLGTKEGLGQIHGKFFHYTTVGQQSFETQLMPLFHPELLKINTNMKKTAWEDMQKAMNLLG
jgi:hypothetical protein